MQTDMPVKWKLKELLEREGVTAYALADKMGGATRRPALYAITSPNPEKRPEKVGFEFLDHLMTSLEAMTGKHYEITDVVERVRDGDA